MARAGLQLKKKNEAKEQFFMTGKCDGTYYNVMELIKM